MEMINSTDHQDNLVVSNRLKYSTTKIDDMLLLIQKYYRVAMWYAFLSLTYNVGSEDIEYEARQIDTDEEGVAIS